MDIREIDKTLINIPMEMLIIQVMILLYMKKEKQLALNLIPPNSMVSK